MEVFLLVLILLALIFGGPALLEVFGGLIRLALAIVPFLILGVFALLLFAGG